MPSQCHIIKATNKDNYVVNVVIFYRIKVRFRLTFERWVRKNGLHRNDVSMMPTVL